VSSTDRCNTFCEFLSRRLIEQGLSRPFVEFSCDSTELGLAVQGQIGAARKILAQQSVGVASLSVALLQLERDSSSIEGVLGSFGIALFTTIFGVAGRVLFVQLRSDVDEVEDEVRRDLKSVAADLRGQLNTTLADFETFQLGVHQAAEEAAEGASKVVQDAISNISRVANAAAENINQSFGREAERVRDLRDSITKVDGQLTSLG
jgi:hypothetical protein